MSNRWFIMMLAEKLIKIYSMRYQLVSNPVHVSDICLVESPGPIRKAPVAAQNDDVSCILRFQVREELYLKPIITYTLLFTKRWPCHLFRSCSTSIDLYRIIPSRQGLLLSYVLV